MGQLPKGLHDPNLLVGFDTADDAAVYKVADDLAIIQTVDFFPPMLDDAYLFGQVAAANALSDVYAMGGKPKLAMNLLSFPSNKLSPQDVAEILRGGADKVQEAGALLCGGHTIEDVEPKYGLCVTGFVHPDRVLTNSGAQVGDSLVSTKPLGSGILTTAAKADLLTPKQMQDMVDTMTTLNAAAADIMAQYPVHACTDITGFGLAGHAKEMASGSGVSIRLFASEVPLMDGVLEMAAQGIIPAGARRNQAYLAPTTSVASHIPYALADALFDPQTSGGLLISLPAKEARQLVAALVPHCGHARIVGEVLQRGEHEIEIE